MSSKKPTIKIKRMYLICTHKNNIINDQCPYCKWDLNHSSPEKYDKGEHSKVIVNSCGHGLHCECIETWLKKSDKCPICYQDWKVKLYD